MKDIDEAIQHCEDVAQQQDMLKGRYDDASGYTRSGNEAIRTSEAKKCEKCAADHRQLAEWIKDYKRLLELQSCEDAISRQAVLDCLTATKLKKFDFILHAREEIKKLPPVTPQPKMGRWIAYEVRLPDRTILNYRCSVCGRKLIGYSTETLSEAPFCHCGAKMVEPQER